MDILFRGLYMFRMPNQKWLSHAAVPLRVRYWITMQELGKTVMFGPESFHVTIDEAVKRLQTPKGML